MTLLWLVLACAATSPEPTRVLAFGDVHGDLDATRKALRLGGLIDASDHWSGGEAVVVQVGDQLDRGDDERAILDLFERLRTEAKHAGGAFHPLLGNHEIMNAAGDLRYVTQGGFEAFADVDASGLGDGATQIRPEARGRVAAFAPGGPYARKLAEHDVILLTEGTLFVHGGVLPAHLDIGIDRINADTQAWLRGAAPMPAVLQGEDAPVWSRHYSSDPDHADCALLAEVLDRAGAARMVVAHTPQKTGIQSACDGRVWRVDTGMARHYGGPVEILEIVGDAVKVLR